LDLRYNYFDSLSNNALTENISETETKGNVIMISGSNDRQTSADAYINKISQGAMTWAFLETMKTKNISWREMITGMRKILKDRRYSQIPQLSSSNYLNIDSKVLL
jgi:hypothetical protein